MFNLLCQLLHMIIKFSQNYKFTLFVKKIMACAHGSAVVSIRYGGSNTFVSESI